jgi:hypothetical protein
MSNGKRTGGGSATNAGALYQSAASAWYCLGILAEQDFPPPLELPADTTLTFIRCETDEPVDDILVMTSGEGVIFAQAKHSLKLETGKDSEFASAIGQCVRQYLRNRSNTHPQRPWHRPLNADTDRLVLVVGAHSSGPIKSDLPAVLANIRALAGRPLDDAAHTNEQTHALKVIKGHCTEAWREASGTNPSEPELVTFLRLVRIQVLDLDADGADERTAKVLLRASVLEEPASDNKAWGLVGRFCEELAASRRGADRHIVQRYLLKEKVDVLAPKSYRADIERLKEHSRTSLALLKELAQLPGETEPFSIKRSCSPALADAAFKGSLLITGDPGSGKSGLLYWLADRCRQDGVDCVVLLVDRIASSSPGELRRDLGLQHDFNEVLKNWPSLKPAVLLVDALDAAREDKAARTIRELITLALQVRERWNVVATIRKFDLRYSEELKDLFRGPPAAAPMYADGEFKDTRHLNVPVLDDAELLEIGQHAPALGALLDEASIPLKDLLRNAFNIRMAADLVKSGLALTDFSAIRSQLELLEKYWRYRVLGSGADEREQLLRAASEEMVHQRSLRVERKAVAAAGGDALETLLSRNVLVEWRKSESSQPNRYILSYSHHVLHDYAIARLLLRGDRERLLKRLATDADFALVARPSISMHFHHLWAHDQDEFWRLSFDILGLSEAPKILQLVGSTVAAESFEAPEQLNPLAETLIAANPGVAPLFFTHLVGAIVTLGLPLVGGECQPWWPFLLRLSESLTRPIAFPLQSLLAMAVDRSTDATDSQLESIGKVSRAFLNFAWAHTPDVSAMVWVGLQGVCRALRVVPTGRDEISHMIVAERIKNVGYLEIPWLAHEITYIIDADPALALDIYRAAFAHEEPSQEATQMLKSRIMPLTSNRRQDFNMALWELAEKYEYFLQTAPSHATTALTSVLRSYVEQKHRYGERKKGPEQTFEFRGRTIELQDDGSGVWDSGGVYADDEGFKVLDAFARRLHALSVAHDRSALEEALDRISADANTAVIWRRLLLIASQEGGETLAELVAPLLSNSGFLLSTDIAYAAGQFLRTRAAALDEEVRGRIEDALIAMVDAAENRDYAEYKRAKLVGCLPIDTIVREPMRELSQRLRTAGNVPENKEPDFTFHQEEYTEQSYLRELGVDPDAEEVKSLVELYTPLRAFSSKFANESPKDDEIRAVYPSITALYASLTGRAREPKTESAVDHAWGYLAGACAAVAKAKGFSCASELGKTVSAALLQAAKNREPTYSEAAEAQFNQHPAWGSPAARIDAAEGLGFLGQSADCVSDKVLTEVRVLSRDPVAAVRLQIARTLLAFYGTAPTFFWEVLRAFVEQETNRGVLSAVVRTVAEIAPNHLDDAIAMLLSIRARIAPTSADRSELRRSIDSRIAQAYVYRDHKPSELHIRSLLASVGDSASALAGTLHFLRNALTYREDNANDTAVRSRAFALFIDMLRAGQRALQEVFAAHGQDPPDVWPEADRQRAQHMQELIQGVSDQVFFASGAFDEKSGDSKDDDWKRRCSRFYKEAGPLLDELANIRLAAAASHHLIETLAFFVPEDPSGVFLRIAESLRSATAGGYQFESLGAKEVVAIVERYIAEYRSLFQDDALRHALMEMLDTFVEAGWPSARRLVYRLDEIFR